MVRALATIWFRLLVVYTVAAVLAIYAVFPENKPWERQGREILDDKPALCDVIEPADAAQQAAADRERLTALSGNDFEPAFTQEFLAKLVGLTEHSPSEIKERFTLPTCIEYRERLAEWYATAPRNVTTAEYWSTRSRRAALFLIPAWLLWGAVHWSIFAPLLRKTDSA